MASESSLRIRRVLDRADRGLYTLRIIPPHTEGTASRVAFIWYSVESSLRIWRVRRSRSAFAIVTGIIPPHTEGTFPLLSTSQTLTNHPSAYGGYARHEFRAFMDMESSLRIRRVHGIMTDAAASARIIPPHTEGTLRKINVFRWSMGNVCQYTIWFFASSHRPLKLRCMGTHEFIRVRKCTTLLFCLM